MDDFYAPGAVLSLDVPSYVCRKADDELYQKLSDRILCYVLASRKMGKSSLRVRVQEKLEQDNVQCVLLDFTGFGGESTKLTPFGRCLTIGDSVVRQLNLRNEINISSFFAENSHLSPFAMLGFLMEEILSSHVSKSLVIFLDEIDTLIGLDFTPDFFAWIRYCYQARVNSSQVCYERLTFCLMGVVKPEDLMKDAERTPFNVGESIELLPFQEEELDPLMSGLKEGNFNLDRIRSEVHYWTGRQPFLTQRLCKLIQLELNQIKLGQEAESVAAIVQAKVINNWASQPTDMTHLTKMRDRLLYDGNKTLSTLELYKSIVEQGALPAEIDSKKYVTEVSTLRLAGLIVSVEGRFLVYSEIFRQIFSAAWADQQLAKLRPYAESFGLWLESDRDDSYLLTGQAFLDAQALSLTRKLTEIDSQYLAASQKLETENVKAEAEQKVKKAEAEAGRIKTRATKRAAFLGLGSLAASAVALGFAWFNVSELNWLSRIEQNSRDAFALPEGSLVRSIAAIRAGQELQRRVKNGSLENYSTYSPFQLLQKTLDSQWYEFNSFQQKSEILGIGFENRKASTILSITNNSGVDDNIDLKVDKTSGVRQYFLSLWDWNPDPHFSTQSSNPSLPINNRVVSILKSDASLIASHKMKFIKAAINREGDIIVSAGENVSEGIFRHGKDKRVTVWQRDGSLIRKLVVVSHSAAVSSLVVSGDGNTIVSGDVKGTVKVWKKDGSVIATFIGHQSMVESLSISDNGNTIVSNGYKTITDPSFPSSEGILEAKVWRKDGSFIATLSDSVRHVAISGDGDTIVSHGTGKVASSFEMIFGRQNISPIKIWKKNGSFVSSLKDSYEIFASLDISNDGRTITAVTTENSRVKVWRSGFGWSGWGSSILVGSHQESASALSISEDGEKIVSGDRSGTIKLWQNHDLLTKSIVLESDPKSLKNRDDLSKFSLEDFFDIPKEVSISRDGKTIVAVRNDETTTINIQQRDGSLIANLRGHQESITDLDISKDGNTIVSGSIDKTVKVWKRDGSLISTLTGHTGELMGAAISEDGNIIVSGSTDKTAKVWSTDGSLLATLTGHQSAITGVAISGDGNIIVSSSDDKTVKVWKKDGSLIATLTGHQAAVASVAISADGNTIVSGSNDKTVKVWKKDGSLINTFTGHQAAVTGIAISENGSIISAVGSDSLLKVWRRDGTVIGSFTGKRTGVNRLAMSGDGKTIITGDNSNDIRIWDFNLDSLLTKGCTLIKDYLKTHPEENKDGMCPK
jgi:WD40 repeat protein